MSVKPRLKPLDRQSIVITGATSGIGLATARRAARGGACVFLIARGETDLKALCEEIQANGGRAAWAVADVADFDALSEAADKCRRLFGGFDTWINNAGVSIIGSVLDTTLEDQRRLFETNYWGVVNGSTLAAEHLKSRPGGGAIINVGSTLSDAPAPIRGAYSASKHAVKGFTNALRMELLQAANKGGAAISLSLVKPAAVDSLYDRHARNMAGYAAQSPQPVYATHVVADAILWCAQHPTREITVGGGGRLIAAFYSALPGIAEPLFARFAPVLERDRGSAYEPYEDGLYSASDDGLDEEVYYPMVRQFSVLAEARKHPGITAGTVALVATAAIATVLLMQRSGPRRYEMIRDRLDPRGWLDAEALRHRFEDIQRGLTGAAEDFGHRAEEFGDDARGKADSLFQRGKDALSGGKRKQYAKQARGYAEKAGKRARGYVDDGVQYGRDHAREGGALLAVATIAAAIGAAALESRRPDSRVRRIAKF
jgi:short-subunit dehydrogenase